MESTKEDVFESPTGVLFVYSVRKPISLPRELRSRNRVVDPVGRALDYYSSAAIQEWPSGEHTETEHDRKARDNCNNATFWLAMARYCNMCVQSILKLRVMRKHGLQRCTRNTQARRASTRRRDEPLDLFRSWNQKSATSKLVRFQVAGEPVKMV
ncbi:hypothetical protein AAP_01089 [Ascosphaera apis ARSEF 7405]|uniref:Uncharacterized protein n=1 Tax=Ascosphaera apis ARSEF 7405 TaxID=392613 RepID=A0A168C9F4_9EURO|nr:hypothetical protein AAP_01089 [Ascosphaera apis ARSEF 7405]